MMIHDVIKIKLSREGYLPDYPPHLISDEEMCRAFIRHATDRSTTDWFHDNFSAPDGFEAEFAELNGWEAEAEASSLLQGLGIGTEEHYKNV